MQVNLRKANAIQSEITKAIAGVKVEGTLTVNEFTTDLTSAIDKARTDFIGAITRKTALNAALYEIRKQVAVANASVGINDVLNEVNLLEAKMGILGVAANAQPSKGFDEIHGRIQKIKSTVTTDNSRLALYGERYNNVESPVLTQAQIDAYKDEVKNLKRIRQGLQDKLLTLNVSNYINLPQDVLNILQAEGIL
jgi:hypothetical protein